MNTFSGINPAGTDPAKAGEGGGDSGPLGQLSSIERTQSTFDCTTAGAGE